MTEAERLAEHLEGIAEVYPIATGNRVAIMKSADLIRQQSARIAAMKSAIQHVLDMDEDYGGIGFDRTRDLLSKALGKGSE